LVAQLNRTFARARPRKVWARLVAYLLFEGRPLTTRGRWINPLVFALYRLWAVLPFFKTDPRPVIIAGVGRSGTTVLGTILALHRDVGYLNEPKALWHAALGDDDLIGSYSNTSGRYRMSVADATDGKTRRLRRFYAAYLAVSRSRRIVDKYPELLFRTDLITCAFPDARMIVLLRNGADICQSIRRWSLAHGQADQKHTDDWWGRDRRKWHLLVDELVAEDPALESKISTIRALTDHGDMAAVEWIVSMRQALSLRAAGETNLLFVHYEDLIADPDTTLRRILRFCDLEEDASMLTYARKTLRAGQPHAPLILNPAIQQIFDETMQSLGYSQQLAA